jgi:hypothetical protein
MADDIQELNALIKDFIKSAEGGAVPKVKPFLTGREVGTTSEGRPLIQNTQGSLSSELSITTEDPRTPGNYINIPSIYYGKVLSDDQALRLIMDSGYRDPMTGRTINSYPSVEEAPLVLGGASSFRRDTVCGRAARLVSKANRMGVITRGDRVNLMRSTEYPPKNTQEV